MPGPDNDRLCVGVIKGTRGLKGELRIKPYTDEAESVAAYGPVETEDGSRRLTLSQTKVAGAVVLAKAKGIETREAAEALVGQRLYVERAALPPVDRDEFYHADLIGLAVEGQDGIKLGKIVAVQNFGGRDLLEVKLETARETAFVPFTPEIVPVVDVSQGKVIIDPPEGLLDQSAKAETDKKRRTRKRRKN